jgi:hypothetical protein
MRRGFGGDERDDRLEGMWWKVKRMGRRDV